MEQTVRNLIRRWSRPPLNPGQTEEYRQLCEEVASILQTQAIRIRGHNDPTFRRLAQHPEREQIIENLRAWRDVLSAALQSGDSLTDDRKLVWRALQRLGMRPNADLMDRIQGGQAIQIFSTDNLLTFVNLAFFDFIHATIDEVFTIVWNEDSTRDAKITLEALRLVFLVKTKRLRDTFVPTSLPSHTASFSFSGVSQTISVDLKVVSPLFGKGGMSSYLIIQDTKVLSREPSSPSELNSD